MISEDSYRLIMSRLVSGVSVVTTHFRNLDLAMTATSVVSVSLDPPTVLFAVHEDARLAEAIDTGTPWVVNILSGQGLATADWLASPGRPAIGQFSRVAHTRTEESNVAILDEAAAWVECQTEWVKPAATHVIVVGRVVAGGIRPESSGAILHAHGRLEQFGTNGEK